MNGYEKYLQLREKFKTEVGELFPKSKITMEVTVDNIHLGEFEQFCINGLLDSKERTVFGENKYLDANHFNGETTDTFHSELY